MDICVDVMVCGDAVRDAIEAPGVFLHLFRLAGDHHLIRTRTQRIVFLGT